MPIKGTVWSVAKRFATVPRIDRSTSLALCPMTPCFVSAKARNHFLRFSFVPVLGVACVLCGCQSFTNPFAGPPPAYKSNYGLTPREKIERLEQLAIRLPSKSPSEQQALVKELTTTLTQEPDPLIRKALVSAIGALSDPYSNPTLHAALDDPSSHVRKAACYAWAKRPSEAATNALVGVLQTDEDADVRIAAVWALGQIRSPLALQQLGTALDSTDPALQMAAMRSLRAVTGQDLGNDVNQWHQYLASQSTTVNASPTAGSNVVQASANLPFPSE